jgi:hypothetical protein
MGDDPFNGFSNLPMNSPRYYKFWEMILSIINDAQQLTP